MSSYKNKPFVNVYDNSLDAFVPEHWANESIAILEENMVVGNLVHRDFEAQVASYGDVVNTRKPGEFVAKRKTNTDDVTIQDATATNVQVPLDQHIHVSFLIRDGEESKSFKSLVEEYMAPSMLAQARIIDQILLGQVYRYLGNVYGGLTKLSTSNAVEYLTGVRNKMNINKAYVTQRNLVLTPNAETILLQNTQFTDANRLGDDGTALREASLGRKYGFDMLMCQNASSVAVGNTSVTGAVNNSGGYPAGTTTMTVDTFVGIVATGGWVVVDGDDQPLRVTAHTETLGATTELVFTPALKSAVLNDAVIRSYTPGTVNLSGGYAAGYAKEIVVTGFSVAPQVGQLVSFASQDHVYSIIQVNGTTGITLDRPLAQAIANTNVVAIGPRGEYNFAFHKNALALVVRPLGLPMSGTGARSSVINVNGLSMRATITYNGTKQGHLVTLDMLCGVALLEENLGAVMLG